MLEPNLPAVATVQTCMGHACLVLFVFSCFPPSVGRIEQVRLRRAAFPLYLLYLLYRACPPLLSLAGLRSHLLFVLYYFAPSHPTFLYCIPAPLLTLPLPFPSSCSPLLLFPGFLLLPQYLHSLFSSFFSFFSSRLGRFRLSRTWSRFSLNPQNSTRIQTRLSTTPPKPSRHLLRLGSLQLFLSLSHPIYNFLKKQLFYHSTTSLDNLSRVPITRWALHSDSAGYRLGPPITPFRYR